MNRFSYSPADRRSNVGPNFKWVCPVLSAILGDFIGHFLGALLVGDRSRGLMGVYKGVKGVGSIQCYGQKGGV